MNKLKICYIYILFQNITKNTKNYKSLKIIVLALFNTKRFI